MPGPEEKLVFVGRTPRALCEQVKDGKGNGGKDMKALREHLNTSLVTWGWGPGNGGTRLRRHMRPSWLRGNGGRPPVRLARPEGIAGAPRRATVRAASLGARAASGPRNDSLDACARCSARHRVHRDSRRSSIGAVARIEHSRHGHFARSIVPSNEPDETPVAGSSRRVASCVGMAGGAGWGIDVSVASREPWILVEIVRVSVRSAAERFGADGAKGLRAASLLQAARASARMMAAVEVRIRSPERDGGPRLWQGGGARLLVALVSGGI